MNGDETVSIIISAWKEGDKVVELVNLFSGAPNIELVAALAEGDDDTVVPVESCVKVVRAPKGRARQMNAGANAATGDIFLFLHADTVIDPGSLDNVREALNRRGVAGGAFKIKIDDPSSGYTFLSAVINFRTKWFKAPYGDQAIFLKRRTFERIGGFDDFPLMEDVRLVRVLKRLGSLALLNDIAATSASKWQNEGPVYTTLRNWMVMLAYKAGVSPDRLVKWYYPEQSGRGKTL